MYPTEQLSKNNQQSIIYCYILNMSSYGSDSKIVYVNVADPSWSIDRKIAWLKRREYLRNNKDAFIPDNRPSDKEYHRWWHTKGKFQTMKHYIDGDQPIY